MVANVRIIYMYFPSWSRKHPAFRPLDQDIPLNNLMFRALLILNCVR